MDAETKARLESMGASAPGMDGLPNLGQPTPPQMSGIAVNGQVWTIHEIAKLSSRDFRELSLGVWINMLGGQYVSPPSEEEIAEMQAALDAEEPMMGADSAVGATAEVIKADGTVDGEVEAEDGEEYLISDDDVEIIEDEDE